MVQGSKWTVTLAALAAISMAACATPRGATSTPSATAAAATAKAGRSPEMTEEARLLAETLRPAKAKQQAVAWPHFQ